MERKTVTISEAVAILGLSRDSVTRAIKNGSIPAIRIGRRHLILRDALERLLGQEPGSLLQSDADRGVCDGHRYEDQEGVEEG